MAQDVFCGNEKITQGLFKVFSQGNPAHGYLFAGPEGLGKRTLAELCAKLALCEHPKTLSSCGQCPSCTVFTLGVHPDFIRLEPSGQAMSITIEQVRGLKQFLSLTPAFGRLKIAILDSAETLMDEAAHALLKTLEEPPQHSVLILISRYPSSLLMTLRSRMVSLHFQPVSEAQIATWLGGKSARTIAGFSGGRPGRALNFSTDEKKFLEEQKRWKEFGVFLGAGHFEKLAALSTLKEKERFVHLKESWSAAAHQAVQTSSHHIPLRFIRALIAADPYSPLDSVLMLESAVS